MSDTLKPVATSEETNKESTPENTNETTNLTEQSSTENANDKKDTVKTQETGANNQTVETPKEENTNNSPTENIEAGELPKKALVPSTTYMKGNHRSVEFVHRTALLSLPLPEVKDRDAAEQAKKALDLGVFFLKRGTVDTAMTHFRTAADLFPDFPPVLIFLGFTLLDEHQQEEAEQCFNRAIQNHAMAMAKPNGPKDNSALLDAFLGLGHTYYDLDNLDKSYENYSRAYELDSNRCDIMNGLGRVLNRMGKYQESQKIFQRCLEVDNQYVKGWNNLGVVYVALGKRDEALECFNKAVSIHHGFPEAWQNMGYVHQELNNSVVAEQCFRNAEYIRSQQNKDNRSCNVGDCSLM